MNRFFIGFFFFWLVMGYRVALAQDTTNTIGKVSIASPTAASLGKYGDYPVSYNTGLPQISIPIYTVQAGSLSLPISLSYHASGLKVQEEASWVGSGWALNAGGVITRTVVGAADDQGLQNVNICTNGHYSAYGYNSYLFIIDPYGAGTPGAAYDGTWTDDQNFQWGVKDGEPDLYFFNFGGYSGKFYFNDDRTPIFVPEEDFKVQVDLNNNGSESVGFQGFIVTTPDGVKYYFGMTGNDNTAVNPIEISLPSNTATGPANSNTAVSSWFLNKIISADGTDSINFTYASESFSEYGLSMFPMTSASGSGIYPSIGGYGMIKTFIKGVRLTGISFPNGQITFTPSASSRSDLDGYNPMVFTGNPNTVNGNNLYPAYSLGSIQVSNANGFCQKDSFYFGYFHDGVNTLNGLLSGYSGYNIQSDTYRLRLDSVQETSCDATVKIPPYKFSYYSELVPRKLSFGLDHWGFYNGVTNNQCLIPTYSEASSAGVPIVTYAGANRDASWPAMRGGALNQITYPTGGHTNFTFEPNTTWVNATNYVPTNRINDACAGCSGNNGGSGNPDTTTLTSVGNSYQIICQNQGGGGNGVVEINPVGSNIPTFTGPSVANGQTDTSYAILPAGNYLVIATKQDVVQAGANFYVTLNEELPVSYNGNDTVGGLRIKSIVNYDAVTPDSVVTNYTYTGQYGTTHSSGILYSRPIYVQSIRNDAYGWVYGSLYGNSGCNTSALNYYISPTSVSPMSTIQGNHIGYNEVDVAQPGNGHSTYLYYGSPYWDNIISDVCTRNINTSVPCNTAIPNTPAPPEPFEPMRGELQTVEQFNQGGQELKEVDYTPVYVFDSLVTPGRKYGLQGFTSYNLQSARKVQTKTVTTTIDPTTSSQVSQTSTVYYGSAWHHQPTRQVTTTSTGDSLATNMVYSMDFQPSCTAVPDSLPYFISVIDADSVTFFTNSAAIAASNWQAHLDTFANMERHVNLTHLQYLNYRLRSFSGTTNLQASCHTTTENSADTALKPILRLQDEFKILPIEVSQWRDNRLIHATFNKYDTSLNPVGFVYPDRTQLINLQAASGTFTPAAISGNTITKDSRYLDETLYQFSQGNPQQVLGHDGTPISYLWNYNNTLPVAKVTNASTGQFAYTSFEGNSTGNWTYTGLPTADSTAVTGINSYYLGQTGGSISIAGLSSTTTYVVTYWSNTGNNYTVSNTTATTKGKSVTLKGVQWTYFEHIVMNTSSITVSNTGTGNIDELRLYPSTAQMTTYTYQPLVGMTTQCDVDSRVSYYYYDALGRLRYLKDQNGNIIKTIQYHYMGQ